MNLPDWHWRVMAKTTADDRLSPYVAVEPTRAAAKRYILHGCQAAGGDVVEWGETYTPRASWDCPVCHVHEGAHEMENLRGDHDWECLNCGSRMWGEPMEWDRIEKGRWAPDNRPKPKRDRTEQTKLPDGGFIEVADGCDSA